MPNQHPAMNMQTSPNSGHPMHVGLPPGHLTPLYGPNDEYMNQGCGDCVPEPSGSQQKKRKVSESPKSTNGALSANAMVHIKREPGNASPEPTSTSMMPSCEEDFGFDYNGGQEGSSVYLDSTYACIRFRPFQETNWHTLLDCNLKEL